MTTFVLDAENGLDAAQLDLAASIIRGGRIAVVPTDTVYGIGALAVDAVAVSEVLAAKGRGRHMPPPVLVPTSEAISELAVNVPDAAYTLTRRFWPGALTLILQARPDLGWDLGETHGTIAIRMPDNEPTLRLLELTGPLAVTSANTTGNPPALSCQEAQEYFGTAVDLYIDGGPARGGVASTIIDFAAPEPRIIRLGALSLEDINAASGLTLTAPQA